MDTVLITAIINGVAQLLGVLLGALGASRLIQYRVDRLEESDKNIVTEVKDIKSDVHDLGDRTTKLEVKTSNLEHHVFKN